ncbi:MAG: hypothetical protein JXA21_00255, partial [Anaerolineae bacterium]|nr:hypothetical protein [Anaerolineae bacterium]
MKHSLLQFREQVYQNFNKRADGLLEVVDALSGQQDVRSVAELSLAASFQRTYSSLYKSIAACSLSNADLAGLGASQLPAPAK